MFPALYFLSEVATGFEILELLCFREFLTLSRKRSFEINFGMIGFKIIDMVIPTTAHLLSTKFLNFSHVCIHCKSTLFNKNSIIFTFISRFFSILVY